MKVASKVKKMKRFLGYGISSDDGEELQRESNGWGYAMSMNGVSSDDEEEIRGEGREKKE